MRMRLIAAATAATLAALVFPPVAAHANHSWGNYHWARTANPFTLRLDKNVTSTWTSYLNEASSDWSASSVLDTVVVSGSYGSRYSCSPTTGHVEVCNYSYGNTGWLGVASISITSGSHISRAYVKVNDTYHNQSPYNSPAYRRLVMCQEIGHTFGLDHQDENQTNPNLGTCMDYTRDPDGPPSNEHPNSHDYAQLQTIYSHTDSFNTPRLSAVSSSAALTGNSPASWGTLVEGSRSEGHSTYVRSFGNRNYTVTHVFWA